MVHPTPHASRIRVGALVVTAIALAAGTATASRAATAPVPRVQDGSTPLGASIDALSRLDYDSRVRAARAIRRAPAEVAVPALLEAARHHADGYVRYKALVLASGFHDPRTVVTATALLTDPNDRLRAVAYDLLAVTPDIALRPQLLAALDREGSEFVRPALLRALVAVAGDAAVEGALLRDVGRGEDYFRSAVIEALGRARAAFAVPALATVLRGDGPLVADAAVALGRMRSPESLAVLDAAAGVTAPSASAAVRAAQCLAGRDCAQTVATLTAALQAANEPSTTPAQRRATTAALAALAAAGQPEAIRATVVLGLAAADSMRGPLALALAAGALQAPEPLFDVLRTVPDQAVAIRLLAEGFDLLDEDLGKEQFFTHVRRAYWEAPEGAPMRGLMQSLMETLDF